MNYELRIKNEELKGYYFLNASFKNYNDRLVRFKFIIHNTK